MLTDDTIVGIDLGTTFSCISVYDGKNYNVIPNTIGNNITPSFVKITDKNVIVGEQAKENYHVSDTLSDTKRFIGQCYTPDIQYHLPLIKTKNEYTLGIKVKKHIITPEQTAAFILKTLKQQAEEFLSKSVTNAVITVPAYFNNAQRQATINAGKIAGLNVLRIINEPTAAALAYGVNTNPDAKSILIVDCGGGTTDVSLLSMNNGTFIVKATAGNNKLGGIDIDNIIMDYIYQIYPVLKRTPKNDSTLKILSEKIKKYLSGNTFATFKITSKIQITLTQDKLNELISPIYKKINACISQALKDAKTYTHDIDYVLCVGGTTRIPGVRNLLRKQFSKEKVLCHLNPDEVVAIGASIQGYMLSNKNSSNDITLLDTIPLSLGVKTAEGLMEPIIEKNTSKPCKRTKIFTTFKSKQKTIDIDIYEGNRIEAKENYHLSSFSMDLIESNAPRGTPQIEVIFEVNNDGILTATARELNQDNVKSIEINFDKTLSSETIQEMKELAEQYTEQDNKRKNYLQWESKIQTLLYDYSDLLGPEDKKKLMSVNDKMDFEIIQDLFNHYTNVIATKLTLKKINDN